MDNMNNAEKYKSLVQALVSIPDLNPLEFEVKRRPGVLYVRGRFDLLMQRLVYLDLLSLGYRPPDPFDATVWGEHDLERRLIELKANLAWAKLNVLNHGFDLIRDEAIREGHDFPFANPRLLFAHILREQRDFELEPILSDGLNQGQSLEEQRRNGALQSKLYRGRLSDSEEGQAQEKQFLQSCRSRLWSGFWLWAIWKYRFKGGSHRELRNAWECFMREHKAFCHFLNSKNHVGNLTAVVFNQGQPIRSSTKTPAQWSPQPIRIQIYSVADSLQGGEFFASP